jgi:hypothetical protein
MAIDARPYALLDAHKEEWARHHRERVYGCCGMIVLIGFVAKIDTPS